MNVEIIMLKKNKVYIILGITSDKKDLLIRFAIASYPRTRRN